MSLFAGSPGCSNCQIVRHFVAGAQRPDYPAVTCDSNPVQWVATYSLSRQLPAAKLLATHVAGSGCGSARARLSLRYIPPHRRVSGSTARAPHRQEPSSTRRAPAVGVGPDWWSHGRMIGARSGRRWRYSAICSDQSAVLAMARRARSSQEERSAFGPFGSRTAPNQQWSRKRACAPPADRCTVPSWWRSCEPLIRFGEY